MRISLRAIVICVSLLGPLSEVAFADEVRLPQEELARESVLPIFDYAPAVLDRNIKTEGRFEFGGHYGSNLSEPFNSGKQYGGQLSYHFTEDHAVNFIYNIIPRTLTTYVTNQLDPQFGLGLRNAPMMKSLTLLNYQWSAFYGKISLTKHYVMNMHFFLTAGAGFVAIGEKNFPTGAIGLGQKFYFTDRFAFRFDMRVLMHQGPNVLKYTGAGTLSTQTGDVSTSNFETGTFFPITLNAGLVFLL
jgi:outer membrane beta-barrel protein